MGVYAYVVLVIYCVAYCTVLTGIPSNLSTKRLEYNIYLNVLTRLPPGQSTRDTSGI